MKYQDVRFITDYVRATDNEIAIDKSVYDVSGIRPAEFGFAPRPAKLIGRFFSCKFCIKILLVLGSRFWSLGGSALFFLFEFFRCFFYSIKAGSQGSQVFESTEYAFAYSSRAIDILHPSVLGKNPRCWVTFPWVSTEKLSSEAVCLDVFSLLGFRDLLRAYYLSLMAVRRLGRRKSSRPWILQSYTAFRWFSVRIALEKLELHRVFIAEHYDRWAVLTDTMLFRRAREVHKKSEVEFVLVQHGALSGLTMDVEDVPPLDLHFKLSYKLRAVTVLYTYDFSGLEVFTRGILSKVRHQTKLEVNYFNPQISLVDTELPGFKVLFVGHPICESLHIFLIENLLNEFSHVQFYYKPHPTVRAGDKVKQQRWRVVEGRSIFPQVNFLVSYPSTLVNEYASFDVPAVVHSLNLDEREFPGFLDLLVSRLRGSAS